MREIKFRQPIFVDGKFYEWHYWGFIGDSFIGAIHDRGKIVAGDSYQYTGLHDKNGKEIYEGDILKIHPDNSESLPCVVKFGRWARIYHLYDDHVELEYEGWYIEGLSNFDDEFLNGELTVIGNVWEKYLQK